jgi:parvulin-like peptidyl-prolyl isomerase
MMTRMRQMTKIIYVIVGLAFIGLIVFEWGADYSGGGPDTTVGVVNGKKLSFDEFNDNYRQLYQNERARTGDNIDESRLNFIKDQVWEQFIQRTLFSEQMEKLNIAVTDSEVVYQMFNYPLPDFMQNASLQTNGTFDINKYRQALPTLPPDQQIALENFYRSQIPYQKLQNIITNSVRVSEQEVLDDFKTKNLKARVEYLAIRPARFTTGIDVSEEEISEYYNKNKEDFRQSEMRELSYVLFPVLPTAADTNRVFESIEEIKERLNNGEEFTTLALEYSEDPSVNSNSGDLGFFDKTTMVKPFSDAAFAASPGDLVGPVKTIHGYHLIKVEDKKIEGGTEKVKASHILLKVSVGSSTRYDQEDKANDFSVSANSDGWTKAIEANGYQEKSTGLFEESTGIIPGFNDNPAILNWAFISKKEDISNVFSTDDAYVVFMIKSIIEKGFKPSDDASVKNTIMNKVRMEKASVVALSHAEKIGAHIKSNIPFREIAESDTSDKITYNETQPFTISQFISGGVGKDARFSANAFALKVGEKSGLVESENAFYYQHLLEKTEFDSLAFSAQKNSLKSQLLNRKKSQVFTDWYNQLKESARITDNRRKFNIY